MHTAIAMVTRTHTRTPTVTAIITTVTATTTITTTSIAAIRPTITPITGTGTVVAVDETPKPGVSDVAFSLDSEALTKLMAWLSPSYPVGAFSYSSGIEWAVEQGDIGNAATLHDWLAIVIGQGSGFCDAVLFAHAHGAAVAGDTDLLRSVAELAAAFAPSRERHLETTAQGRAFLDVTRATWPCPALDVFTASWDGAVAYPVAVAVTCAGHGIALKASLNAYLHAVASNLISAGVRLVPLGQTDGQRILAQISPLLAETSQRAMATPFDDIGSAAFRADLAAMRHETQYTRLFRS